MINKFFTSLLFVVLILSSCIGPTSNIKKGKLKFENGKDKTLEEDKAPENFDTEVNTNKNKFFNKNNSENDLFLKFQTIIKKNCNGCHKNKFIGDFTKLKTVDDWIQSRFVNIDSKVMYSNFPFKSSVYSRLKGVTTKGNMPQGKKALSIEDRNTIKTWLNSFGDKSINDRSKGDSKKDVAMVNENKKVKEEAIIKEKNLPVDKKVNNTLTFEKKLKIYLSFNSNSTTSVYDESGNNNHGVLRNGAKVTNEAGLFLDGINDALEFENFDFSGKELTITAKFKSFSIQNCKSFDCRILSQAKGVNAQDHTLMLSTVKVKTKAYLRFRLKINGKTQTLIAKTGEVQNNETVIVNALFDGTKMILYKNGLEVGRLMIKGEISKDTSNLLIVGANDSSGTRPFKGEIKSLYVHKKALSKDEIQTLNKRLAPEKETNQIKKNKPLKKDDEKLVQEKMNKVDDVNKLKLKLGKDYEENALNFLKINCNGCHSKTTDTKLFKVSDITNIDHLINEELIIPGNSLKSPIWKLTHNKKMPPSGSHVGDLEDVRRWIDGISKAEEIVCGDSKVFVGAINMNRYQLNNTINDLFLIDIDLSSSLPSDFSTGMFDNQSGESNLTPLYINRLLKVSEQVMDKINKKSISKNNFYICKEQNDTCLRKIISNILPRAFRRPVTSAEIDQVFNVSKNKLFQKSFSKKIQSLLDIILLNPTFLHRLEGVSPVNKKGDLTDHEIASRISYGLLGTMPSKELMSAANKGKLHTVEQVQSFIKEILKTPQFIKHFSSQFARRWLNTDKVKTMKVNMKIFPQFDKELKNAMSLETLMVFEDLVKNNRPLNDFLTVDFTYLNEKLAHHYKVPNVRGSHMRRVSLENILTRGGLITHGSILAQTSTDEKPSLVHRGLYVLDRLLCSPPEPPADMNILSLGGEESDEDFLTLREQLDLHTSNKTCQACHQYIDPYAFGQLNFDAIGTFRTKESFNQFEKEIDSRSELITGETFNGIFEMQDVMNKRPEFKNCSSYRVTNFLLGSSLNDSSRCEIRKLAKNQELGILDFILEIYSKEIFLKRKLD